jgi:hypothetical protein
MQSTVAQIFSPSDLAQFSSVHEFRDSLGGKRHFSIQGVTRIYGRHILKYNVRLSDLEPSLTIIHPEETFHISRILILRISGYFRDLENLQKNLTKAVSYTVHERVSRIGLVHLIDTAQGRRQRLSKLSDVEMDQVIAAAEFFKVKKILSQAAPLFISQAKSLDVRALITFSSRIRAVSSYYDGIFSSYFSAHLQRLIMRSRFVQENELPTLLEYLEQSQLSLALEFKHWAIDPAKDQALLAALSALNIRKLNLLLCTGSIDLNQFKHLQELKGSNNNFINIHKCTHLKLLNVDSMPSQSPQSLRELTLRDALPKQNDLPRRINRLSLHSTLDVADLGNLENENIRSLKITSRSGHLTQDSVRQIEHWHLTQLTLSKVSMPTNITQLPSLENLREATVIECDPETQRWILSSTQLTKLRIRINGDENFANLPSSLVDLSLEFAGPAEKLSCLANLQLESLCTSDVRWSEGGLEAVGVLTTLKELSIQVSGDFLPGKTSALTQLVQLNTFSYTSQTSSSCFPATDVELNDLMKLTTLKVLKIRPDYKLLPMLTQLTSLEKLEQLDLFGTSQLEWKHLPLMNNLKELRLRACRWIEINSAESKLDSVPALRHLEIPHLLGDKALLFSKIPSLETLILDK